MSTLIEQQTKSVDIIKEGRTYKININTPKGEPYWIELFHEIAESHDGSFVKSTRDNKKNPISFLMSDVVAREDTITYYDPDGAEKTVPARDIPSIVQYFCDVIRSENQ